MNDAKNSIALFLVLVLFSFNGCLNNPCPSPEGYSGRIHLIVSIDPLPISETKPSDIRQLLFNLSFAEDPSLTKTLELPFAGSGQEVDLSDLRPGKWNVEICGIDDARDVIFHNTKKIQTAVISGEDINLAAGISLSQGTFQVTFDASKIPGLGVQITRGKLSILHPDSKRTYPYLDMDGQILKAEIRLNEGVYQVKIGVPDFDIKSPFLSPVYSVTIRAGKTVCWSMSPDGSLK